MKSGIDYFPLNVQLDSKWALIVREFGAPGLSVVVTVHQYIYGGHGYYCEWNPEVVPLFAEKLRLGRGTVSEIIKAALRRGIFDADLYKKYGILTSREIQETYFTVISKRKSVKVDERYLLVNCAHLPENVHVLADFPSYLVGTSIKESKVKESKESIAPRTARRASAKVFDHDSKPYKCAAYLDKEIQRRLPKRKPADEATLQRWADSFDKVNRIDGYDWDLIAEVLEFSQDDLFWRNNILSGDKFRKQFTTLYAQMEGKRGQKWTV